MFLSVTEDLLLGFGSTLKIFALTLLGALPLGLLICFGSMSRVWPLHWLCRVFVWIIRGTPLMLQLIVVYYGPGLLGKWALAQTAQPGAGWLLQWLSGWTVMDRFGAVLAAFIINYACYFSEIYRGGLESIPRGQYEAGQVLGMTRGQIFTRVVLLQVIRRIVPPMGNEIITLVKDTSLARVIAVYEIIWTAQSYIKRDGLLWPLLYTGVFYLAFSGLLTLLFQRVEKRLARW